MRQVFILVFLFYSLVVAAQQVGGGNGHAILLDKYGDVFTIGRNNFGQLGDSSNNDGNRPVQVTRLPKIKSISRGYDHSPAIDSQGNIWAWAAIIMGNWARPF